MMKDLEEWVADASWAHVIGAGVAFGLMMSVFVAAIVIISLV